MAQGRSTLLPLLLFSAALVQTALAATEHNVGDTTGWDFDSTDTFYNNWAKTQTFVVGDSLKFTWAGTHNAVEVTPEAANNCDVNGNGIANVTTSGETLELTTPGEKGFLCSVPGHCSGGMKMVLTVVAADTATSPPPPTNTPTPSPPPPQSVTSPPPPPPPGSAAPSRQSCQALIFGALFAAFAALQW